MTTAADLIRDQIRDLEHAIAEAERAGQQSSEALDLAIMRIDHEHKLAVDALKAQRRALIRAAQLEHGAPNAVATLKDEHCRLTKALALIDVEGSGRECPECGRRFQDATGLGVHRKWAHDVAGATTAPKAPPKPVAAVPDPPKAASSVEPHLECEGCGAAFPADQADQLTRHVERTHGRRPTKGERTPKRAAAA